MEYNDIFIRVFQKAIDTKAACKCDEVGNCEWQMKSSECVPAGATVSKPTKAKKEKKEKKKDKKNKKNKA